MVGNVKELQGKRTFDELVDRDAAARFLEVSPRTLDRWHLLREGPPESGMAAIRLAATLTVEDTTYPPSAEVFVRTGRGVAGKSLPNR